MMSTTSICHEQPALLQPPVGDHHELWVLRSCASRFFCWGCEEQGKSVWNSPSFIISSETYIPAQDTSGALAPHPSYPGKENVYVDYGSQDNPSLLNYSNNWCKPLCFVKYWETPLESLFKCNAFLIQEDIYVLFNNPPLMKFFQLIKELKWYCLTWPITLMRHLCKSPNTWFPEERDENDLQKQ